MTISITVAPSFEATELIPNFHDHGMILISTFEASATQFLAKDPFVDQGVPIALLLASMRVNEGRAYGKKGVGEPSRDC